jgi:hypothetical protein
MRRHGAFVAGLPAFALLGLTLLGFPSIAAAQPDGLTVHEWGTFTSVAGENGKSVDWNGLSPKRDLPRFVEDAGVRCSKWGFQGNVRMETPVIYFYSSSDVSAHVSVRFPHGVITEWYPHASTNTYESRSMPGRRGSEMYTEGGGVTTGRPAGQGTPLPDVIGAIDWNDVKIQPNAAADFPDDLSHGQGRDNPYYAARQTDGAPVAVGIQREKFLFYRGVARFQVPLLARLSGDGKVLVVNNGPDAVAGAILFENRQGRIGYRNLGAIHTSQTAYFAALSGSLPELRYELEEMLVSQGLFRKEAHAMVETWRDSWFEEGSRIIYLVPARVIDSVLPLEIDPAPARVTRVFVGRIELLTADMRQAVQAAVETGDASIAARYGRFLDPMLDRVEAANPQSAQQVQQLRVKIFTQAGWCQ